MSEWENKKVILFGGSFDPPHAAHALAAGYLKTMFPDHQVWVLPAFIGAYGKKTVPFQDRVEMCHLMFDPLQIHVTGEEQQVPDNDGKTVRVLEYLSAKWWMVDFYFAFGTDTLSNLDKWFEFERVIQLARPIILGRQGHGGWVPPEMLGKLNNAGAAWMDRVELPAISSSRVREAFKTGDQDYLRQVLHPDVLRYVKDKRFYLGEAT